MGDAGAQHITEGGLHTVLADVGVSHFVVKLQHRDKAEINRLD